MSAALTTAEDPTSLILRGLSHHECRRFDGKHLRVRGRGVVHDVRLMPWIGGLSLPVPACHQPVGGLALVGAVEPTEADVTCRRCRLFSPEARTAPRTGGVQLTLV